MTNSQWVDAFVMAMSRREAPCRVQDLLALAQRLWPTHGHLQPSAVADAQCIDVLLPAPRWSLVPARVDAIVCALQGRWLERHTGAADIDPGRADDPWLDLAHRVRGVISHEFDAQEFEALCLHLVKTGRREYATLLSLRVMGPPSA
jgi:hypothetical protein